MDLLALADFNAVALHGGFSQASRVTGRPKATLSRRVRQLEDALGVRLLERGARTLRLTDEGRELKEQTQSLLERIDEVADGLVRARRPRGRLRVSAPVLFAQRGLGRIAAAYAAAYPEVALEIVADDRFVDPLVEDFDLVLRANPDPSTDLAGRCFLRDRLVVVAHPRIAPPAKADTAPAVLLGGGGSQTRWSVVHGRSTRRIATRAAMRLSSMSMIHDAVLAGAGAAAMPLSLVQPDLDAGRLKAWGLLADRHVEAWALYPSHRHVSARAAAFVELLVSCFAEGASAGFARVATLEADPHSVSEAAPAGVQRNVATRRPRSADAATKRARR